MSPKFQASLQKMARLHWIKIFKYGKSATKGNLLFKVRIVLHLSLVVLGLGGRAPLEIFENRHLD